MHARACSTHQKTQDTAALFKPTDPVVPARIPEQKVFNGVDFPLVLEPHPDFPFLMTPKVNPHPVEGVSCRPDGRCSIDAMDHQLDAWVKTNHDMVDQLLLKVCLLYF